MTGGFSLTAAYGRGLWYGGEDRRGGHPGESGWRVSPAESGARLYDLASCRSANHFWPIGLSCGFWRENLLFFFSYERHWRRYAYAA